MNILVDIRSLLDKPYTGVAQYTLNFLNDLLAKDSTNQHFLFYNSGKLRNKDLPVFNFPNVKIINSHYPNKLFNFCLKFFKWPKIDKIVEKKIGRKIDEIFLPNFNFCTFSKNTKITLVAHDLSFEIYPHFFTFKQRLWHKLVNPRKLCQQATKIITHSENTKNDIIRFYKIEPAKIEIKTPLISKIFKEPISEAELNRVKDKYKLPDNFILYLGRLEPRKNLDTLIRAFSQFIISALAEDSKIKKSAREKSNFSLNISGRRFSRSSYLTTDLEDSCSIYLVIAGEGRERKKLEKLVEKISARGESAPAEEDKKVKFLGYIPEQDKKALYHLAKIFVYPSFYEGYGYPVAEALACGTPVITSHTSSLTEIEGDKIIFINPYDINDLNEAIKRLEKSE